MGLSRGRPGRPTENSRGFASLPCDYRSNGNANTISLGVGIGIAIGIELLRTDPDTDSDTDPELLTYSHRLFNPTTPKASLTPGYCLTGPPGLGYIGFETTSLEPPRLKYATRQHCETRSGSRETCLIRYELHSPAANRMKTIVSANIRYIRISP
jgi:hypothetical protein